MRKKIRIGISILISMIIACDLTNAIVSSLGKITEGIKSRFISTPGFV